MKEEMGISERIMEWIVKNRIFVRERKSNAERALGNAFVSCRVEL